MQYSIVSDSLVSQMGIHEDHKLTHEDTKILSLHRKTIEKFILQKAFSVQTELGMGARRGKEDEAYGAIAELNNLAKSLAQVELKNAEMEMKIADECLKSSQSA